jgi:endonuclease/exonuclease/phosphatase family metal-dependent hydrolase
LDIHLRLYLSTLTLILTLLAGCTIFPQPLSTEQRRTVLEVQYDLTVDKSAINDLGNKSKLKVLSLNLAHGRKDSFTQFFVGEEEIRQNLADIAEFLKREGADIVTLQEADAPSRWSGNFNHVEFLAREAGYPWYTQANHVENWFGNYGTAVLSRLPITRSYGYDFNPTPPTTQKGFTLAEIEWRSEKPNQKKIVIDVISVHLDFSRRSKRIEQIEEMKKVLGGRSNPTIVLGDFNSEWIDGDQELQELARKRKLRAHRPEANSLYTYFDSRLDWILVSEEFNFCNYYTAPDILSDHLAVISELIPFDESFAPAECS